MMVYCSFVLMQVNIILANDADSLSLTIKPGEMITRELQFSPYYQVRNYSVGS